MVEEIILKNKISKAKLELGKITTPYYILDSVDWGQVTGKAQTYKFVNQAGETVENVIIGTRPISITGWIIANDESEMTSRKAMLNLFVNPQQEMELLYKEYKLNFYPETSIQYGITYQENNDVIVKFKISGICYEPLFQDENDSFIDVASVKGFFHFPLIINKEDQDPPTIMFGVRQPSLITTIVNSGQVTTGFKIVFIATGGVTNPSFTNVISQESIKINKSLVAGERVEINTSRGSRSIIGELNKVRTNYSRYRDLDMSWLQIEPGENMFSYSADSGMDSLDVYIYYNNKYLEVQQCY